MTLKIKCKDIDEYVLGGVKKIVLDEEYLYTTIYDTRKYRRVDIEKIEVIENYRQEEIDNLKVENKSLRDASNALKMHYEEAMVEIKRLNKENGILSINADNAFQEGLNEAQDLYAEQIKKQVKSEAIKEFAKRLKCGVPQETGVIRCYDVDNLVKEMAGEE